MEWKKETHRVILVKVIAVGAVGRAASTEGRALAVG